MTNNEKKLNFLKYILIGCVNNLESINLFTEKGILPDETILDNTILVPDSRIEGMDEPNNGFTMIGLKRMDNLHNMLEYVRLNNIEGDLIETGVWRGGATIYMKYYCKLYNMKKKVFVCDSFKGLPKPSGKFSADLGDEHYMYDSLKVSLENVQNNFKKFDCLDDDVIFIEGFFGETLPNNKKIKKISLLRMDGDMYESTHDVFYSLYHKVTEKAPIIIDDYCLSGCKKCVDDFISDNNITQTINNIDRCGVYWFK
jgi:hypothetical protein